MNKRMKRYIQPSVKVNYVMLSAMLCASGGATMPKVNSDYVSGGGSSGSPSDAW